MLFAHFCSHQLIAHRRVKAGHYVATHGRETPEPSYAHANRGYWTDGEESMRAPSERTLSEYTVCLALVIFLLVSFGNQVDHADHQRTNLTAARAVP